MEETSIESKALKKLEQIKTKNQRLLSVATWVLLGAIGIGLYLLLDYTCIHAIFITHDNNSIGILGTFISGTSGILIGASTIIFLIYNVRIQNESLQVSIVEMESSIQEMKDSNKNFLSQKKENLFFNLLDNHDKLINNFGTDKLTRIHEETINGLNLYFEGLQEERFMSFEVTKRNPVLYYDSNPFLIQTTKNICHIIKYIEDNLEDKEFYHETLSSSINGCVKFYLELSFRNQLLPKNFMCPEYYFSEYLKVKNRTIYNSGYIPSIEIAKSITNYSIQLDSKSDGTELTDFFTFKLKVLENLFEEPFHYCGYQMMFYAPNFPATPLAPYCDEDIHLKIGVENNVVCMGRLKNYIFKTASDYFNSKPETFNKTKAVNLNINVSTNMIFSYPSRTGKLTKYAILFNYRVQVFSDHDFNINVNYIS